MSRAKAIPNRKEVLWGHDIFGQMPLRREIVFQEMTSLRFLEIFQSLLANANLY